MHIFVLKYNAIHKLVQLFSNKITPGCSILVCFCVSPCGHIGGEVGTVVGIHELGSASDVLPLSGSSATCRRFTAFYKSIFFSTNTIWNELAESIFIPVSLSRQDTSLFQPFPSSLAGQLHQIWLRLKKTGIQNNLPFSKT